ncbi:MAG: MCE family protein, partial [Gammaproteobacteria bacterium]|nr:MCE family protein [Gammaproteobacteria bacterium]
MSESITTEQINNLPESNVKPRSRFSIVWLVPIIAILIGAWLAYKAWSEMGPEISLTFKTADGLEAGKTKIKYKNVEFGTVTTVEINPETHNVDVTAEMEKKITPFLTDKSSFWVVRARVNASGVSGLGTLLSGAYINIDPSTEGKKARKFTGLEIPPVVTSDISGKRFILHSKSLGSIQRDVPVFYRKFNVGRVEDVKLNDDGQSATINIFINSPYDKWVNTNTKFWNSSGVDVSMSAAGFDVKTESLVSILIGGISFDSDKMSTDANMSQNNAEFTLFNSQKDTIKTDFSKGMKFVINFSESVRGLTIGAPVEFRGIQLGEVTDIQAVFDPADASIKIPVTVEIDNSKILFKGNNQSVNSFANRKKRTKALVERGLRTQLETGNLLTGQLYISLDFFPDAEPYVMDW